MTTRSSLAPRLALLVCGLALALFSGCSGTPKPEPGANTGLTSRNSTIVIQATQTVIESRDTTAIPQLIRNLRHSDDQVRYWSVFALKLLSGGRDFGFIYYDDAKNREPAVRRWENWNQAREEALARGESGADPLEEPVSAEVRYQDLRSSNPLVVIAASKRAGRLRDPEAVPLLIPNLTSQDSQVRLWTAASLELITGEDNGYFHDAPPSERKAAKRRWEDWWKENRERLLRQRELLEEMRRDEPSS